MTMFIIVALSTTYSSRIANGRKYVPFRTNLFAAEVELPVCGSEGQAKLIVYSRTYISKETIFVVGLAETSFNDSREYC